MKNIVFLFLISFACSVFSDTGIKSALRALLEKSDTGQFVHVGDSTKSQFISRQSAHSSCEIRVKQGDTKSPIGDGRASNHVYISCPGFKLLGVRFKTNQTGKYHVLGFWSE